MASIIEIILKATKSGSGFKDAERDTASLSKAIGGLNRILGGLGLALGAKELFEFGQASVTAARESAAAEAELQAALTSSGQATDEYKEKLEGLATALENTSLFSDETIQKAEATLVTFKNLGQDIMPQVIATVVDMGQKMGDMGSAAQLAGIALQAPEQAAARLQRQGIMLSETQKEQIDNMVNMGNIAGAQGVILDALNTKFGGQAQAARDAAGSTQDYSVAVGRLQEAFGGLLLTIGDAGATDQAVGWIDRLTEGASAWTSAIENIQLLTEANQRLTQELTLVEQAQQGAIGQVDRSNNAYKAAEEALGSLIGWFVEGSTAQEGFAEAVQDVTTAARAAPGAIDAMTAASNRAALAGYAAMRGMMAQAQAARDVAKASKEVNQGQLDLLAAKESAPEESAAITENRAKVFQIKKKQEEEAAADSKRIMSEANQAIAESVSELGNQISSAVSGAISGVSQDVIGPLLGLDNAEANAGEAVRRMAAVAAGGIQNEWAPALAQQLTGVKDATAQAFVQAFSTGDDSALKATAQQLALNPIVELFDANLIAAQVEQKLRAGQLSQALNDKVNAILGEKGLPAVAAVSQQVGQAATDTGTATGKVQQSTIDMAATATTAGEEMRKSFDGTITQINIAIQRLQLAIGLTERWGVVAGETAGQFNALNPPAAGSLVPNGAQRRMGGSSPL